MFDRSLRIHTLIHQSSYNTQKLGMTEEGLHPIVCALLFLEMNGLSVWCSALQCVVVRCSVLRCAMWCTVLSNMCAPRAAPTWSERVCSVMQCVAVCCSVMKCVVVCCSRMCVRPGLLLLDVSVVAVWCSSFSCAAMCCRAQQCDAVCCQIYVRPGLLPLEDLICIVMQWWRRRGWTHNVPRLRHTWSTRSKYCNARWHWFAKLFAVYGLDWF